MFTGNDDQPAMFGGHKKGNTFIESVRSWVTPPAQGPAKCSRSLKIALTAARAGSQRSSRTHTTSATGRHRHASLAISGTGVFGRPTRRLCASLTFMANPILCDAIALHSPAFLRLDQDQWLRSSLAPDHPTELTADGLVKVKVGPAR